MENFVLSIFAAIVAIIILFLIRRKDEKVNGKQVSFYLIWYGIGRLFIEGLRTDSLHLGKFRISQIVSIIAIILGIVIRISRKKKLTIKPINNKNNNSNEVVDKNGRI